MRARSGAWRSARWHAHRERELREDGAAWDAKLLESDDGLRTVLCQTVHRNLFEVEWKQYVPEGEKHRAVCDHLPLEK